MMTTHKTIDLRSDTVTRPTAGMRAAMAFAEVGDDVYEDDPTVNALQAKAATLFGKEAGLFVPSGTMGNAIAIKAQTTHGDEILLDAEAHSMVYELGLPGAICGVLTRSFRSEGGVPDVDSIPDCIHEESLHNPGTRLIVLENTHNRAGGAVIPLEIHRKIRDIALEHGIKVHIDGARIFHAAIAAKTPVAEFAATADTLTFCLSKGLGCPVGSVLVGSREFIERARRVRKMLGGGLRQAGILAAAGIYALDHHIDRIQDDHDKTAALAARLADAPGVTPDTTNPPTNMLYVTTHRPAEQVYTELQTEFGILCNTTTAHRLRFVMHLDVSAQDAEIAADAIAAVCAR
jgi:threonine aldolase